MDDDTIMNEIYSFRYNLYNVLEVEQTCSKQVLKESYQKLILIHHPDKKIDTSSTNECNTFHMIQSAWTILSRTETRLVYDHFLQQQSQQAMKKFDIEVNLSEFTFDVMKMVYYRPCRCGDRHEVSVEKDVDKYFNQTCNLVNLYFTDIKGGC